MVWWVASRLAATECGLDTVWRPQVEALEFQPDMVLLEFRGRPGPRTKWQVLEEDPEGEVGAWGVAVIVRVQDPQPQS